MLLRKQACKLLIFGCVFCALRGGAGLVPAGEAGLLIAPPLGDGLLEEAFRVNVNLIVTQTQPASFLYGATVKFAA